MYAADIMYRSLAPLGMTGPGGQPNVAALIKRHISLALAAYMALDKLCYISTAARQLCKSQFIGMYAADVSHRSLTLR